MSFALPDLRTAADAVEVRSVPSRRLWRPQSSRTRKTSRGQEAGHRRTLETAEVAARIKALGARLEAREPSITLV